MGAVTVESARTAVAGIAREAAALVITDVRMSGMDGLALFATIQRQYPHLPVMILTVLAIAGGYIQVFDWWEGMETWLEPVAPALHVPSGWNEALSSMKALRPGIW